MLLKIPRKAEDYTLSKQISPNPQTLKRFSICRKPFLSQTPFSRTLASFLQLPVQITLLVGHV